MNRQPTPFDRLLVKVFRWVLFLMTMTLIGAMYFRGSIVLYVHWNDSSVGVLDEFLAFFFAFVTGCVAIATAIYAISMISRWRDWADGTQATEERKTP